MQQKYLWGGAALILLGAAATYMTVDYAIRNPASMLARLGAAATFAALNPNPLSDIPPSLFGEGTAVQQRRRTYAEDHVPTPAETDSPAVVIDESAEETIEPIQIEPVPLPTAEPPTGVEESEWTMPKPVPDVPDVIDDVNDDENACDEAKPDDRCLLLQVLRAISALRSGLPYSGSWEEIEDLALSGALDGCLQWLENCVPVRVEGGVAPRTPVLDDAEESEQPQKPACGHGCGKRSQPKPANETQKPECTGGCYHGCGERCQRPCWPPK
jgi:hypothetical protein